jgi:hypothetical protein
MQPTDPDDSQQVEPFVDHAWRVMEWHRERAEAWDRLATQVVAFSGIIIALTPNVFPLVQSVDTPLYRHALAIAIVLTIGLLIASSIVALLSLSRPLRTEKVQTELIQQAWQSYRKQESSSATFGTGVAQTLIGYPGERTAVIELRNGADQRQTLTRFAVAGLASGIILIAIVLSIRIISI